MSAETHERQSEPPVPARVTGAADELARELEQERRVRARAVGEAEKQRRLAQGVDRLAPRAKVEAYAEDGQIEAFTVPDAPAFALALQWHPEHRVVENPVSMKLFGAFADACRVRATARLGAPLRAAAE